MHGSDEEVEDDPPEQEDTDFSDDDDDNKRDHEEVKKVFSNGLLVFFFNILRECWCDCYRGDRLMSNLQSQMRSMMILQWKTKVTGRMMRKSLEIRSR